uniref:Secreted protein n=1 Tax=Physcomitrium patens TaxID=3218 RepID=A0A2K1J6P4_PHYPA|nr:hypothetical protein PHYPA_020312 [Physcomitrium patens]
MQICNLFFIVDFLFLCFPFCSCCCFCNCYCSSWEGLMISSECSLPVCLCHQAISLALTLSLVSVSSLLGLISPPSISYTIYCAA